MADDDLPPDDTQAPAEGQPAVIDIDAVLATFGGQFRNFDPWTVGRALGMTDRGIRFAVALVSGLNATRAALAAGYQGDPKDKNFRGAAARRAKGAKVVKFRKAAEEANKATDVKPLTDDEKLERLARGARSANDLTAKACIDAHTALQEKMGLRVPAEHPVLDVNETLREIASISPELADCLARQHGIIFSAAGSLASPSAPAKPTQAAAVNGARAYPSEATR